MNAITPTRYLQPQSNLGTLLFTGYEITDGLYVDLYGQAPDDNDEYFSVEAVAIGAVDITGLISARKLELLGIWLDTKDNTCAQRVAMDCRHEIAALD